MEPLDVSQNWLARDISVPPNRIDADGIARTPNHTRLPCPGRSDVSSCPWHLSSTIAKGPGVLVCDEAKQSFSIRLRSADRLLDSVV